MSKSKSDVTIFSLKSTIENMERDSLVLSDIVRPIGDKKLQHIVKIIVGTIQALRMFVLSNQDVLKNLLVTGGTIHGETESQKAKRVQRQRAAFAGRSKRV